MNAIPSEILDGVIQYLSKPDIASLRLVCRGFSSFGTAILFETVHVFLLKKSFERLASISQHDIYRHHVQSLVFYGPFLEGHRAIHGGYLKAITLAGGLRKYGVVTVLDNETVAKGLEAYQKYHQEQAILQGNGEAYAKLATAMGRLDRLDEVNIGYLGDCMGPAWETDLHDYPILLRQIAVDTFMPAQQWYWECPPSDHFMTLLRAVSVSNTRIHEFRFEDPGPRFNKFPGSSPNSNDHLRDGDLDHLKQAFQYLKHLNIRLRHSSPIWKLAKASDNFALFLILCPALETLDFRMPTDDDDGYTPFRTLSFPRLQRLTIGDQNTTAQELVKFVEKLPTLRTLALGHLALRAGDWDDVFEGLRDTGTITATKVENLYQHIDGEEHMYGTVLAGHNDEVNQLVTEYVMGKTEYWKNPTPKEVEPEDDVMDFEIE